MKHLVYLVLVLPLFFTSCSQDDTQLETTNDKMLESFVIKRNANGSYTLTHEVSSGVNTVYYDEENTKEVQLFFDGKSVSKKYSRDYNVTNNELNINIKTENNSRNPQIKIVDDNTFAKGAYGLLDDYTVRENADGTVELSFVVDPGVSVKYGFNEAEGINDIYLAPDVNASETTFTKVYTRNVDGSLKVDFVQQNLTKEEGEDYKKPRLIVIET